MDNIPQDRAHGPGQAYALKLAHCLHSGLDTPSAQLGRLLQKTLVFCLFFLKCVELGLAFRRVPPADKRILRQSKPDLVPALNPWQKYIKSKLKEKPSLLKPSVEMANSHSATGGGESLVPHIKG